jgi:hypothetical protein
MQPDTLYNRVVEGVAMHEDLVFFNGLDSARLHAEGHTRSKRLAGATWDMAVCLLAIDQRRTY